MLLFGHIVLYCFYQLGTCIKKLKKHYKKIGLINTNVRSEQKNVTFNINSKVITV